MVKRKRRMRRLWSAEEKINIVAQAMAPGVSVAQIARRYDLNANQIFNWAKDPRYQPAEDEIAQAHFLPVEIIDSSPQDRCQPSSPHDGDLEIELAHGIRLRVHGAFDPDAIACLVRSLSV